MADLEIGKVIAFLKFKFNNNVEISIEYSDWINRLAQKPFLALDFIFVIRSS